MARCAVSDAFVRVYGAQNAARLRRRCDGNPQAHVRAATHTRLSRRRDTYGDAGHPCSIQPSQSPSIPDPQFLTRAAPSPGPPVSCAVPAWELQQHTEHSAALPCPSRERTSAYVTHWHGVDEPRSACVVGPVNAPSSVVHDTVQRAGRDTRPGRARGGVDGAALGDGASAPGVR